MVTGEVGTFTETGIQLKSGETLNDVDLVVTATGMNLHDNFPMSTIDVSIDGTPYDAPSAVMYRGLMLANVPNLAYVSGTHDPALSWTLKSDAVSCYLCNLLRHMDKHGHHTACPRPGPEIKAEPWTPMSSGYFVRSGHRLPRVGQKPPWNIPPNFWGNRRVWLSTNFDDDMEFSGSMPHSRL